MTTTHDRFTEQAPMGLLKALDGHKGLLAALHANRNLATANLTGAFGAVRASDQGRSMTALAKASLLALQPMSDHAQQLLGSPAFASMMRAVDGMKISQLAGLGTLSESFRQIDGQISATKFPAGQLLADLESARRLSGQLGALGTVIAESPWMRQVTGTRGALDAALSLKRNFLMTDPGLTAALAVIRSGSVGNDQLSRQVARIGKGWASLTDRVLGLQPQLLPMLPATTRLASRSYILNIASDTHELPVEAEELFDTRREMHDPTAEWLSGLSQTLLDHWLGMWERINQKGPAWRSQAAHCAVEFLTELLRVLAPTEQVVGWQVAQGKYGNLYLPHGQQQPQYILRMLYIGAVFGVSRFTVEGLFSAVPRAIKSLQKIKHTSYADEEFETWIAATSEVVAVLVPNRPR